MAIDRVPQSRRMFLLGAGASRHAGYPLIADLWEMLPVVHEEFLSRVTSSTRYLYEFDILAQSEFLQLWQAADYDSIRSLVKGYEQTLLQEKPESWRLEATTGHVEALTRAIEAGPGIERNLEFFWTLLSLGEIIGTPYLHAGPRTQYGARRLIEMAIMKGERRSEALEKLCSCLIDGETIATTNYDLLLDRALFSTGKWNPTNGYGIAEKSKKYGSSTSTSSYSLLKLHGSINWTTETSYSRFGPTGNKFWIHFDLVDESIRSYDIDWTYLESETYIPWNGQEGFEALIVEPAYKLVGRGEPLGEIWDRARACIEAVDLLVCIGYSFPPADRDVALLVSKATQENLLRRIVVIDPDRSVFDRVRHMLGEEVEIVGVQAKAEDIDSYRHLIQRANMNA